MNEPLFVAAVLIGCVIVSEWLVAHSWLRHAGVALVVIIVGAAFSNAGVIPTGDSMVYSGVFRVVAPLSIFWLLLGVDLRDILKAGAPLLGLFLAGAGGTVLGVVLAVQLLGVDAFGEQTAAMAGMFSATYIGGSANFNAIALHYEVMEAGPLYAGAMAVDSGLTAVWMAATIALPRWLSPKATPAGEPREPEADGSKAAASPAEQSGAEADPDAEVLTPGSLAVIVALGFAGAWAAQATAAGLTAWGVSVPSMLLLTVIALGLAQIRGLAPHVRGARTVGMFAVYVFLAAIGALCDISALASLGAVGGRIAVLACVTISVHGLVSFAVARLLKLDPALAAVASQANVGGGTTALALARSLGRPDLVLPAVLIGSVGTALGTFVGFAVAGVLSS